MRILRWLDACLMRLFAPIRARRARDLVQRAANGDTQAWDEIRRILREGR